MTFGSKSSGLLIPALVIGVFVAVLMLAPAASAQLPDLVIDVGDTTSAPGANNTAISIFLSNYNDTVAGFNIWVQLDRPDIMLFQTDSATVIDTLYWKCLQYSGSDCVDSQLSDPLDYDFTTVDTNEIAIGSWDTTGTLINDWQSIDARSLSGFGYDLNIVGIANMPSGDTVTGIPPQAGGVLIRLMADVLNIPDTATGPNRTVNILVQHQFTDHFSFSRPDGSSIGLKDTVVQDTNYWICTAWAGDVCLNWQRTSSPPADSIEVVEDTTQVIDYENVIIDDGSLTVLEGFCGDVNGSGESDPNVADLTYLIDYLFRGGPPPSPVWVGDVNCSGSEPNVSDLTYMVDFLFRGGTGPCEGPDC